MPRARAQRVDSARVRRLEKGASPFKPGPGGPDLRSCRDQVGAHTTGAAS
jgi:hypothetical protein